METKKRMEFYGGTFGACFPLLVFLAIMMVVAVTGKVSLVLFCMAGFAALCVAFLLARSKPEFEAAVVDGIKNDTLCVIIFAFLLAGVLSQELRQSGLIQGLTWLMSALNLSADFLPLIAFVTCALISTACGTSNGAIVAVLPVLLPVAGTVGAIVSGAIFGDNLALISDTTIASALTQKAEVRDVVRTRLPYSLAGGTDLRHFVYRHRLPHHHQRHLDGAGERLLCQDPHPAGDSRHHDRPDAQGLESHCHPCRLRPGGHRTVSGPGLH
nr:Na+/H+ antiporter NhaC family protein [uncultured Oscillibacter sp.]